MHNKTDCLFVLVNNNSMSVGPDNMNSETMGCVDQPAHSETA